MSVAEALAQTFPAPEWWLELDASQRILGGALLFSLLAHGALLTIQFAESDPFRLRSRDMPLEVILVNAKHASAPVKPDALAQANLDGGGTAEKGRAQSFLPNQRRVQEGDQIEMPAMQRVRELESQQQKLMSSLKGESKIAAAEVRPVTQPDPTPPRPEVTGTDIAINARNLVTAEAEIAKRIAMENARPKRGYVTPSTRAVVYAMYYRNWADKIERIGNNNYPANARGNSYQLTMTVSVLADGSVEKIEIERSSGNKQVDEAARRIVNMGAPFSSFPPAVRAEYGVLDLTMKWTFSRTDALSVESQR